MISCWELNALSQACPVTAGNAYETLRKPVQLSAAQLAYRQHTALYETDWPRWWIIRKALYALNRAEIDYEIAQNIWRALFAVGIITGRSWNIEKH